MWQIHTAMVVDTMYAIVTSLARHPPGENVYLMTFSYKGSSQFAHMDSNASNCDRMK
jgi:hypothetical protein